MVGMERMSYSIGSFNKVEKTTTGGIAGRSP